jgi:hypothetical protein
MDSTALEGGRYGQFNHQGADMKRTTFSGYVIVAGVLSGCSMLSTNGNFKDKEVSKYGPGGLVQQPIERVDLIALVSDGEAKSAGLDDADFQEKFQKELKKVRGGFSADDSALPAKSANLAYVRNRIQDRLIAASNDKCESYKTVLKEKQSTANFYYGLTSILSGAAGAIADGVQAARNLAAISGVSTSLRAEHNQDYYAEMAAHVIAKGITQKRKVIADAIYCARQQAEKDYTIERAIGDSLIYHGACSLIGGLETLDHVLTTVNVNVGTDALSANQFFKPYLELRAKELGGTPAAPNPQGGASAAKGTDATVAAGNTEAGKRCIEPVKKADENAQNKTKP